MNRPPLASMLDLDIEAGDTLHNPCSKAPANIGTGQSTVGLCHGQLAGVPPVVAAEASLELHMQ